MSFKNWVIFIVEVALILATGKVVIWAAEFMRNKCIILPAVTCEIAYLAVIVVYCLAVTAFVFFEIIKKYWVEDDEK